MSPPETPSPPFTVRAFREGDEAGILDLFHRCFHPGRTLGHWRWEYRGGPYGPAPISVAEGADGRLVAHYAGYPVRFFRAGSGGETGGGGEARLTAFHIGDTMTAPEVRNVGRGPTSLLARTVDHFYDHWCRGRVGFNYGFNVGNIQRFSVRFLGLRVIGPVHHRVRRLGGVSGAGVGAAGAGASVRTGEAESDLWASGPPLSASRLSRRRVERITAAAAIDARFDDLFACVRADYAFLVERDARYLRWRYLGGSEVDYAFYAVRRRIPPRRLAGWSVFRRQGDRLVWGDALFDHRHPGAVRTLLAAALADPAHRGVTAVEGWFPPRPAWWSSILDRLGFVSEPEPQDLRLAYVPFEADPGEELANRLYYTKGDGDLF